MASAFEKKPISLYVNEQPENYQNVFVKPKSLLNLFLIVNTIFVEIDILQLLLYFSYYLHY